jgi:predicted MFS family arabinose efflux permease
MKQRTLIIAILSASLAVMLSSGIRQSFGLFLAPISEAFASGREVYSLAIAISNLLYGLPLVGILSDRIGSRWVLAAGGLLYGVGLIALARITQASGLYLTMGVAVGLALSATTYVVVLGAVGQLVPPERRSSTFGIITAAGSSGMFVLPPLTQFLLDGFGWQTALIVLGGSTAVIILLAFGLPNKPPQTTAQVEEPFLETLKKARGHVGYLLLITGFFVCGFHVAFIATHLPAYLSDNGLSSFAGAAALSLIGGFNIVGSFFFGWLGDTFRKKYLLSLIYMGRVIVIALFLLLPLTQTSALVFAGAIGFLWLATVPLTSGTVAQIFGVRYLSTLFGIVFLSHQVGAFLGVWLGGRYYDTTGSYDLVWVMAIGLGVLAALVHMPISEAPLVRPQRVGTQVNL